jgi:hypothetical protein
MEAIEFLVSAIGVYSLVKNTYSVYSDAKKYHKNYKNYKNNIKTYIKTQKNPMTETQYIRNTNDFFVIESKR